MSRWIADPPLAAHIGRYLLAAQRQFTTRWYQRLVDLGYADLRPAHGRIFQFIDDDGSNLVELAERAQLTKQSVAELVQQLEAAGYLERVPDPRDKRAKLIRTTDRGEKLFVVTWTIISEIEADWTQRLGVAGMDSFRHALSVVAAP